MPRDPVSAPVRDVHGDRTFLRSLPTHARRKVVIHGKWCHRHPPPSSCLPPTAELPVAAGELGGVGRTFEN